MIDVLVIAVIGGLYRLEGAWWARSSSSSSTTTRRRIGFIGPRFHTLIGVVFLAIVLVSPAGLVGIWERAERPRLGGRRVGTAPAAAAEAPTADAEA